MIIWLSSYPKSGNTWLRSFLSSLLYTKNGEADFEAIKKISQYPRRSHFNGLVDDLDNVNHLSENWIPSQALLNLDNKIKFFKTHHMMCNFGKNSFTNYENTFGVIYIVRDPRNIITSLLNHFSKETYSDAKNFIFDENKVIGRDLSDKNKKKLEDKEIFTLISSWKTHYNSWKNFKKNFLLIKYENLINDKDSEFQKIRNYLDEKLNLSFSDQKFAKAVNSNLFQNLKKIEKNYAFEESLRDRNIGNKKNFFNLGPENDFNKILNKDISKEIETFFYSEMKELKYI